VEGAGRAPLQTLGRVRKGDGERAGRR